MTLLLILAALLFVAHTIYLARFIAQDGRGTRAPSGLPRSHHLDPFEPHRRI